MKSVMQKYQRFSSGILNCLSILKLVLDYYSPVPFFKRVCTSCELWESNCIITFLFYEIWLI